MGIVIFKIFTVICFVYIVWILTKGHSYTNQKTPPPESSDALEWGGFGGGEIRSAYYFIIALKKFGVFEGRASRREFWHFYIIAFMLNILSLAIDVSIFNIPFESWGPANLVTALILIIPSLSIGARRLHDVGKSGWWQLISLTGVGIILLIAWWASKPISGSYSKKIKTEKTSSKSKLAEELRDLKELYKDGTLSKEEFTKAKNKLLK